MAHFVGLEVSVKETAVCVVDEVGEVVLEQKVPSEPDDIVTLLTSIGEAYGRVGIEAGPLSQWLVNGLATAGLPVVCVETRHMQALLKGQQINKSDRNDARGIAQMMRVGLFKPVHVKTLVAQEQRMLLTSRKLLQRKMLDVECDLRGTLRNFGLKVGTVSTRGYEARIRELVEGFPKLAAIVEPLLTVRRVMRQQFAVLHKMLLDTVRHDPICRRLMTAPGVGVVVALTYRATIDQPQRFVHSRAVGAHVALYVQHLALEKLAAGQQHPLFLGNQGLHMHRLEQPDPHHLRDPARVVAVALVDLLRLEKRLHVPGLDADNQQPGASQTVDQPLRERAGFDPDPDIGLAD